MLHAIEVCDMIVDLPIRITTRVPIRIHSDDGDLNIGFVHGELGQTFLPAIRPA